jgi:multiple sugar transport system permease protein
LEHSVKIKRIRFILIAIWVLFALLPVYWMVVTAFKTPLQIYSGPFFVPWIDFQPSFFGWEEIVTPYPAGRWNDVSKGVFNSVFFATASSIVSVVIGALAGYGLARFKYKYGPMKNNNLGYLIISQRIMPPIVAVLALFLIYQNLGLQDSAIGMIIIYTWFNVPIAVFLLQDFFSGIPSELEEAAAVDGYGRWEQLRRIVLPLSAPGVAVAFMLCWFFAWNDFLLALILTFRDSTTLPIVISVMSFRHEPNWNTLSALGLIAIVPPAVLAVFLDKYLAKGLLKGGLR